MIHKKVLIVEDDVDLNSTLRKFLTLKSFECLSVFDGQEAVDRAYENDFDIIVLDGKLPSLNGFEVAREIRKFSATPIIFLTSLDGEKNMQEGFGSGGDDYITKPFSLNELHLRLNAILRRVYKSEEKIIISESIYFDMKSLTLFKDSHPIHLTQKEIKLLTMFLKNSNKIFTREEIYELLYDYAEEPSEASLRVFINKIRKYIGKEKIETIKGMGYRYVG